MGLLSNMFQRRTKVVNRPKSETEAQTVAEKSRIRVKLEVYRDIGKRWRWRLRATNGKIVANSGEGFQNKQDCIYIIRELLAGPEVYEEEIGQ